MPDPVSPIKGIDNRIHHRGARSDRSGLARPLDPHRIGGRRHVAGFEIEIRHVSGTRQSIIHQGGRDQLALGIIDRALEQSLPDPLTDAAMHLSCQQQWVHRQPEIVTDRVTLDADMAGIGIDADFCHMGAVGIGRIGRHEIPLARAHRIAHAGLVGEIDETHRTVGASNTHTAVDDFKIGHRGFQRSRGQLLQLIGQMFGRPPDGNAADRNRARTACAVAGFDLGRIALHHPDPLKRQIEMLGGKLRIGGSMALPVRLRARIDRHIAIGFQRDFDILAIAPCSTFDIGGQTDAAQQSLFAAVLQAVFEACPIRRFQCATHMAVEITGIIGALADRGLVGHRTWRNEIAAADLVLRQAGGARGRIDQPFKHIGRLGTTRTAIGIDRHRIGIDPAHLHMQQRRGIDTRHHRAAEIGNIRPVLRQIGPEIAQNIEAHRQEPATAVERDFGDRVIVAALAIADEMIPAFGDPFDRTLQPLGGFQHQRIFAIDKGFGTEPPADIAGDDADIGWRHFHDQIGHAVADAVDTLGRHRQGKRLAGRVIFADGAAGFDVIGHKPVVLDIQRDRARRFGKGRIDLGLVAHRGIKGQIVGLLAPDRSRTFAHSRAHIHHRLQRLIGHRHGFGGIAGYLDGVGNNKGHRIADMFDGIDSQRGRLGDQILGLVIIGQRRKAGHGAEMGKIGPRQHQPHAFDRQNGREIAYGKAGMGMGRAQHQRVQMPLRCEIGHIVTATGQQTMIFHAAH